MQTLHAADAVLTGRSVVRDGWAVLVDGPLIAAVGPLDELTAACPRARTRRWPGLLLPGLRQTAAAALLEAAYHPDPREADLLGAEPLTGDALAALAPELDETRWGGSARRGLQRMLAHGTTAVTGPFLRPSVRTAVTRSGLRIREPDPARPPGRPSLDLFAPRPEASGDGANGPVPPADLLDGPLTVGAPADLAVFAIPSLSPGEPFERALRQAGAASCVATVLGGRLVHRRA